MKKKIYYVMLALLAISMLSGCKKKFEERDTLRIGMMASDAAIPYVILQENGLADKYGIRLELTTYTSAADRDAAFTAGKLDGVLTDYISVCKYKTAEFDVKITGITDGDYVLVSGKDSGITSIDQIEGKSVAISENTLIDYTLDKILENNGLIPDTVNREIVAEIPERLELLQSGKTDLAVLPEPYATVAIDEGAINLGSANSIDLYPAVSAFSQTAIDNKWAAISSLYSAYDEAVDYINNTDVKKYQNKIIKAVGYPKELKGKIELPEFRKSTLPPQEDFYSAVEWASNRGLCMEELAYDWVVYSPY